MAKKKGPGRAARQGISVVELFQMFPANEAAERWFEQQRWPNGITCPRCASSRYAVIASRKPMPYRCKDCRKHFSVRVGTVMQDSNLGLQKWVIAIYMMTVGIKGTSSMRLHRDLKITQACAWHLMQRIRQAFVDAANPLPGPVEVDEPYIGGIDANKHANKKPVHGNTYGVKQPVVGMKSRETNQVKAQVVQTVSSTTLQRFVKTNTEPGRTVYSEQHRGYWGLRKSGYVLESVNHSVKEYVNGQAHTNCLESFWALLKRGYYGTYHKMSAKHLPRYVNEFAGRHNIRERDTIDQMAFVSKGFVGKRLRYRELVA